MRTAHRLAIQGDITDVIGQTPGHQVAIGGSRIRVLEVLEFDHRLLDAISQLTFAQRHHVLPKIEAKVGLLQVTGQGQAVELDRYRRVLNRDRIELEVVHIAFGLEVLAIGIGLGLHGHAREAEGGVLVQLGLQCHQLHMTVNRAVVTQGDLTFERSLILGCGKPLFGKWGFFQRVIADRHHWHPLERLDTRPRQWTMLDIIDKQQFHRLRIRARLVVLDLQAIVRGAAVEVALNGNQLNSAVSGRALQLLGQLLVGLCNRRLQHALDFAAGVPRASGVQRPGDNNDPYQHT